MKKKRLTPNQKKMREELERIFEITEKFESQNLIIDYNVFKEPKRISKKYLQWLHNLNEENLLDKALYNYNGELIPANELFTVDDFYVPDDTPDFSDIVLQNLRSRIADFPSKGAKLLENLLNKQIDNLGYRNVAESLENNSDDVIENCQIIIYASEQEIEEINSALYTLITIIQGHKPSVLDMMCLEDYEDEGIT